jgi:glycosyltransferase involved in cell wall biosynthesis
MPLISIIVPCYNEEATISLLLEAVREQTFPVQEMELIISDGLSTDNTRQVIAHYKHAHPELSIVIVDNIKREIPSGLNKALESAQGKYIIRLDAHSIPDIDYVERCVQALESGKGENVGGLWMIKPGGDGWISRSIARAASHPLGVGDARYRLGGVAQAVDTVPFGAFSRELIESIGPYDENLLTNEDYEFNVRVRNSGRTVWFDPQIKSTYIARATLPALAKQYWRYGYWKAQMLRRYPESIRWRQALPPIFIVSLIILSILSLFTLYSRWLLVIETALYLLILVGAGIALAYKYRDPGLTLGTPLAFATMHFCWGSAFVRGAMDAITNSKAAD